MTIDIGSTTIHRFPHGFINKRAEPILVTTLTEKRHPKLIEMYLAYRPRNSFSGLPPIRDEACIRWVRDMIANGANLVAMSFEEGIVGHGALFPASEDTCEMLLVISPGHQKVGIGGELARCLIQLGQEMDFGQIRLCVEAGNHVARHVYEKCGFAYLTRGLTAELDMSLDLARCRGAPGEAVRKVMNPRGIAQHPRDALQGRPHDLPERRPGRAAHGQGPEEAGGHPLRDGPDG